jgi:myo-inositol catabolism protein IolC
MPYQGNLFILAFDHRGSFKKKMFGISGREPTAEEQARLIDAKRLVWEGVLEAVERGAPTQAVGVLVDEEMGADVARAAKERGIKLAMPVESSGKDVFDFEYGEAFGEHIETFDPEFAKVLVRWNPDDDAEAKQEQRERLRRLSEWLHGRDRLFLFELLVPASPAQLARLGGLASAYDTEIRPAVTLQAIEEIQDAGIEPDIWKIEGLDRRLSCELLAELIRRGGRDGVVAVVLGRGADDTKVAHWLETGASVPGYAGFAIGRTIWWDAVAGVKDGTMARPAAVGAIADNYLRFIDVYTKAQN